MPLIAKEFWAAKAGNSPDEYEDAFAVDIEAGRFAIADGATESSFAKKWAQLLVTEFVANSIGLLRKDKGRGRDIKVHITKWLAPLQKAWRKAIDWRALLWFAEEKARSGAFATFLGLEFDGVASLNTSGSWQAIAVGDCELFHVRDNKLKTAFPLTSTSEFSSSPPLLCSNQARNRAALAEIHIKRGKWRPGDLFLLCTDALAQWFLAQQQGGAKPWSRLRSLGSQEEFEKFAAELWTKQLVRNDDMTLVIFEVG